MRLKQPFSVLVLGLALAVVVAQPALAADTPTDVAEQLMCMCGCGSMLPACMHAECGVQTAMMDYIKNAMDKGESSEQIVAFFLAQYGDEVLSAPPKKGFNLWAWVTPFAALLVGGAVVYVVLKRWVRRDEEDRSVLATDEPDELDGDYRERLEKELADFSERSFR